MAPDTGSVAMKTRPNAKPPSTRCQCGPSPNIGLVLLPIKLNIKEMATTLTSPDDIIRHDPIPDRIRTAAPNRQARVEVSPIDPGIRPKKASNQLVTPITACTPPSAAWLSGVARLTPSNAVQTLSPLICAG